MTTNSKVFVLTGASRGIGLAIAHYLLERSNHIVAVARNEAALKDLESKYKGQVAVLAGDCADLSLAKSAIELAEQKWQRLDGLIVNHGVLDPVAKIKDCHIEEWQAAFKVNYFSVVAFVQAAIPALRRSKGSIVLTSSGAATKGYQGWAQYGSAKAAVNHLAMTLSNEESSIVTLSIRPGVVDTEMQRDIREKHTGGMSEQDVARFTDLAKSGGLLKPEQPGHVMARLALSPPQHLSGRFLSWDAEELGEFQER